MTFTGATPEECDEKAKIMLDRVHRKFEEIDKKYDPIDSAIIKIAELIGEKINIYDSRIR